MIVELAGLIECEWCRKPDCNHRANRVCIMCSGWVTKEQKVLVLRKHIDTVKYPILCRTCVKKLHVFLDDHKTELLTL